MRVIKEADGMLYEAKRTGKNKVCVGIPLALSQEVDADELATLKGYFVYFDQASLVLESETMPSEAVYAEYEFNFYPPEFFFRRCVEGLYRRYRDPDWVEMLTIIKVRHSNPGAVRKEFCSMFRLADVVSVLEPGVYGILFVGMPPEALSHVGQRIREKIEMIPGSGKKEVRIAAAELRLKDEETIRTERRQVGYPDFAKRIEEVLQTLKRRHFLPGEEIYFLPVSSRPSAIRAAG